MIGLFDSGIGGLTVWREVAKLIPNVDLIYVADQARVPYGGRPTADIRKFSEQITASLVKAGASLIVVACNTATAAAIVKLREKWPDIHFVGMEPALKPASHLSKSRKIGVLATASTIQSKKYADLTTRFTDGLTIYEDQCVGLVEAIEAGDWFETGMRNRLNKIVEPMLEIGVDTLILGCTHYPFVKPVLQSIVGDAVTIIDPAPAVARQVVRLLSAGNLKKTSAHNPNYVFKTSGDVEAFRHQLRALSEINAISLPLRIEIEGVSRFA